MISCGAIKRRRTRSGCNELVQEELALCENPQRLSSNVVGEIAPAVGNFSSRQPVESESH